MKSILFISLVIISLQLNAQIPKRITQRMVTNLEESLNKIYLVKRNNIEIHNLDTLSIEEIKSTYSKNYFYYKNNSATIKKKLNHSFKKEINPFLSSKKRYLLEEEKTNIKYNVYQNLINNNHTLYRNALQSNRGFEQKFENGKSRIEIINDGSYLDYINLHSNKKTSITHIYYHNSEENNVPIDLEFDSYIIPQQKHVDSIDIKMTIDYLTKIDTIRFAQNDIGIEKKGILLQIMEDNFVAYLGPAENYYYDFTGKILEEEFYNTRGEVLDEIFGRSFGLLMDTEGFYQNKKDYYENIYLNIKELNNRKDIYNSLKYFTLKYDNERLQTNLQLLKGNAASLKLYLESQRDSLVFSFRLKNISPVKKMYIHKNKLKTELIDKNGNTILQMPDNYNFLNNPNRKLYSEYYFYLNDEDYLKTYYFLDIDHNTTNKLPYKEIDFICPTLLYATGNDNRIVLLGLDDDKLLVNKKFISYNIGIDNSIQIHTKDSSYQIYDQDNKVIEPTTTTSITKIILKKVKY